MKIMNVIGGLKEREWIPQIDEKGVFERRTTVNEIFNQDIEIDIKELAKFVWVIWVEDAESFGKVWNAAEYKYIKKDLIKDATTLSKALSEGKVLRVRNEEIPEGDTRNSNAVCR